MMDSKSAQTSDLQLFLNGFKNDPCLVQDNIQTLVGDTDETTALRILARFVETLDEIKKVFETSVKAAQFESVWMLCHKVSSSSELLGFVDFSNHARRLEKEIKDAKVISKTKAESSLVFASEAEALAAKIRSCCLRLTHYR